MAVVTVALLQMASFGYDQEANLRKGEAFCRRAKEMGADISLFPEMWNIGYSLPSLDDLTARKKWRAQAISAEGPFVTHSQELARELQMAIALSSPESADSWRMPAGTAVASLSSFAHLTATEKLAILYKR